MTRALRMSEEQFATCCRARRSLIRTMVKTGALWDSKRGPVPKYRNKIIATEDGKFHSQKEHWRWLELKGWQARGLITDLRRQVPFVLAQGYSPSGGRRVPALRYFADFVYKTKQGWRVVEDTKGYRDRIYKIKKHLMAVVHNIEIVEV